MERQIKLFRNTDGSNKKGLNGHFFPKADLVGVDYEPNSASLWKISSEMAINKFKEVYFTPRYIKKSLGFY